METEESDDGKRRGVVVAQTRGKPIREQAVSLAHYLNTKSISIIYIPFSPFRFILFSPEFPDR